MKRRFFYFLLIALLITLLIPAGCREPEKKPIDEFRYQEPEITLYDHNTGEKKRIKMEE